MAARSATTKPVYRIRTGNQYNDALVRRGSLTLWVDHDTLQAWRYQGPTQRGAQFAFSDTAIECLLTLKAVYHLTLRATEGFARSLFELMRVDLDVPDSSTLCRRAKTVRITLPKRATGPLHLILDSTGLKVDGEGEWKVRQHGYSKRRTWLKLHLAVDPETHEIRAAVVTEPGVTDEEAAPALLTQEEGPLSGAGADGAYDRRSVSEALDRRGARAVIPPGGMRRSGGLATPPVPGWPGTRTCAASVRSAGRRGSGSRATTVDRWARRRCFA